MPQSGAPSATPSTTASEQLYVAPPAPSEVVIRPSGLRHGRWEAPPWAFYVMGGVIVLFSVLYLLYRLGIVRMPKRSVEPNDDAKPAR